MYKDISAKRSPHNITFNGVKSDTTYNKKEDYKIMLYELSITKEMVCKHLWVGELGQKSTKILTVAISGLQDSG